ncbi:MAG TPA: ATP-binding protein [Polyangia bacterium]|jgi:signal transduction histidine kinase/ActR/RegA family two-component response regulator|nr:ATP-binding protein [Polyangia bacterium]
MSRIRTLCAVTGLYAAAGGVVALLGWALGVPRLTDWGGQGITMKANTALCAALNGGALLLMALGGKQKALVRIFASLVAVIAALTIVEHLTGVNLGIDTFLFDDVRGGRATTAPGRMGPPASISFSFLAAGLLLLTGGTRARRWASVLPIVPLAIATLGIVGYLYRASELYAVARFTGVALQTSTMIAALSIGLCAAVPEHGFLLALRGDDAGGVIFRRLLPPIMLLPLILGWLRTAGERAGLYDTAFGTAARTLVEMVLFAGLLWWTAKGISQHARAAREAEQALRDADRRKDEFLATLAHELRNPLAPLRTGLEVIRRHPYDDVVMAKTHAMMERQVGQIVHLVDDLLDISRISRGKIELRLARVEVAAVLASAVETSRPLIDAFGHELVIAQPAQPIVIVGDVTRLAQVVGNLLNNAAKYTNPGGRIDVKVERQEQGQGQEPGVQVRISVRDNGVGIPPDLLPKLFEMFVQVARPVDQSREGLGIGLALVKRLVGMHGGQVTVHSPPLADGGDPSAPPAVGTEFIVSLPVAAPIAAALPATPELADSVAPVAPAISIATSPSPGGLRILVADDNVDGAEALASVLEDMGNEVRMAHDGAAAFELATAFRPDLAFLDIGMPKMTGHELASRIRAEPWGRAIVLAALTGWGQSEDRRRSREAGFDHHLVKPITVEALQKVVGQVQPAGSSAQGG